MIVTALSSYMAVKIVVFMRDVKRYFGHCFFIFDHIADILEL